MSNVRLARGRWIITGGGADDATHADGAIAIEDGLIAEVGDWPALRRRYPEAEVLGSERTAVMPGLINAHHHSNGVSVLQQGVADQLLEPWLLMLSLCRPIDRYLATLLSAARLLRSGVTAVVDVFSGGGTAQAYHDDMGRGLKAYDEAGIRVAFAAGVMTQSHLIAGEDERFMASLPSEVRRYAQMRLPAPGSMDEGEYFAVMEQEWRRHRDHRRIDIWFAPPGPQWVSDRFMQDIAERAAAWDTGIQTHVTESIYEKLHGPRRYGKPTIEHLRDLGVLGPRFSIAHGVWLTDREIAIMAETGTGLSHNPSSNLRLRAGIAPLNALLASGVTAALGMDGTTLDDDEDYFTEMRLAMRLHRTPCLDGLAPSPSDILRMATAGGAKLMGKGLLLGRIAAGYAADLVLLDLDRLSWPWIAPECDGRDLVLMRAKAGDVKTVLVGGDIVLQDGRPTGFDIEAAGREAAAQLARQPFPAEAARMVAALLPPVEAYYKSWPMPPLDPHAAYNSRT